MTESEYKFAKLHLSSAYGCTATRRGPGRPISTGIGKKVTIYLPNKSMELLDRISRDWSGSRSDIIQEAIARYAADLDGVIQEGENSHG